MFITISQPWSSLEDMFTFPHMQFQNSMMKAGDMKLQIYSIMWNQNEPEGVEITSEELTPIVRDNYTAILLICDPEGGAPKTFYSVKGSLGGDLSVNTSGQLEWNVESITTTFDSPITSYFTIGGNCAVFCYTFDAEGNLTGQTDTGNTVPYRR